MGGLVGVEEGVESLGEEERRRGGWDGHGDGRGIFDGRGSFYACRICLVPGASGDVSGSESKERAEPAAGGRKKKLKMKKREKTRNEARKPAGRDARHEPFALARSLACSEPFALDQSERSVGAPLFFLLSLTREFCVTLVKFELRDTPALKKCRPEVARMEEELGES